jgi:hypothetical protein
MNNRYSFQYFYIDLLRWTNFPPQPVYIASTFDTALPHSLLFLLL